MSVKRFLGSPHHPPEVSLPGADLLTSIGAKVFRDIENSGESRKLDELAEKFLLAVGAKKGHALLIPCDSENKIPLARAVMWKAESEGIETALVDVSNIESSDEAFERIKEAAKGFGVGERPVDECNIINLIGDKSLRGRVLDEFAKNKDQAYVLHLAVDNAEQGENPSIEMRAVEGLLTYSLPELQYASGVLMKKLEGAKRFRLKTYNSDGLEAVLEVHRNPLEREFVESLGDIRASKAKWGNIGGEIYTAPSYARGEIWLKKGARIKGYTGDCPPLEKDVKIRVKKGEVDVQHETDGVNEDKRERRVTVGLIDIESITNQALRDYLARNPEYRVIAELGLGLMGGRPHLGKIVHDEKQNPHVGVGDQQAKKGTISEESFKIGNFYSTGKTTIHTDFCFSNATLEVAYTGDPGEDDWTTLYEDGKPEPSLGREMYPNNG